MKLNLRSIDLNLLPVFEALMQAGQLSRAAEQLGMSQPAFSAAVQRLRDTVGDELFVRTRQGLKPTPRAIALWQQLQPGVEAVREAFEESRRFDAASSERRFVIIGTDYIEQVHLPRLLDLAAQEAPHTCFSMQPVSDGWHERLAHAQADVAIDSFPPDDPRLHHAVIGEEEVVVIARRGHPRLDGHINVAQFLEERHVVLQERGRRLPLDMILNQPGWQRQIAVQVSQFVSQISVCAASDLIATVPASIARLFSGTWPIQVLPFPTALPAVPVCLIWPATLERDPAHIWMRQSITRAFSR
ncbi:LysR family transcriptional regulator [Isoalcanivorax indicus]|uniref:LysR family transcriptional regulator n=1 Tax=Isoalcanivorax indicus TaxID=2202653 RepID=UPI000DBAADCA|nr:LysR family transcriptional regulator [Isoalcanivorax indicus]